MRLVYTNEQMRAATAVYLHEPIIYCVFDLMPVCVNTGAGHISDVFGASTTGYSDSNGNGVTVRVTRWAASSSDTVSFSPYHTAQRCGKTP